MAGGRRCEAWGLRAGVAPSSRGRLRAAGDSARAAEHSLPVTVTVTYCYIPAAEHSLPVTVWKRYVTVM